MSRPTIYDVARIAGVSPATVSRVINGFWAVRPETRARVLAAVDALGFHAAATARSLKTARTRTIALLIHRPQYPLVAGLFGYRVIAGLEMALAERGYDLVVNTTEDDEVGPGRPNRAIRRLLERRPDGIVLLGPAFARSFIVELNGRASPIVLVDNRLPGLAIDSVTADDEAGGRIVAEHLARDHGHRLVAFLGGPRDWSSTRGRLRGVRRAIAAVGGRLLVKHAVETTIEAGERAAQQILRRHPDVTSIVAVNDAMALGALRAADTCGRRIPDDLAVTGFDDIALAELVRPALTTVHVPAEMLGSRAAQFVLDRLAGRREAGPGRTAVVPVHLVVRSTCGCTGPDGRRPEVDVHGRPRRTVAPGRGALRRPERRRVSMVPFEDAPRGP